MTSLSAYAEDTIGGVATDSGNISVIGNGGGRDAPDASSPERSSESDTVAITTIYTGCSVVDPTPCATEVAIYCAGRPTDGPTDKWRVSTTQVFAAADKEQAHALSTTTGCANFAAAPAADAGPSQADVRELMVTLIPTAGAGTSPQPDASGMAQFVVNLPLIVYAVGDTEVTAGPVPLVGHDVEVSAAAVSYRWEAGGEELTADQPGVAYNGASCTSEDCAAYLHLDPFRSPGRYQLTLTTSWEGRYRVDGGAWIAIDDPIEKVSAPTTLNLREARGVLVHQ